jgi:hypothetical protein
MPRKRMSRTGKPSPVDRSYQRFIEERQGQQRLPIGLPEIEPGGRR